MNMLLIICCLIIFSIQVAIDVSIPESLGGLGGEAIYIDTEGSFIIERVADIAKATSQHCHRLANGKISLFYSEGLFH